ncbi:MAG: M24 family metallopeptidase [Acidimicrobiales bacterium]
MIERPEVDFTRQEFADRLAKTRRAMDVAGIDVLVVPDPSNMAWLTGYDGWSFYTPQCVIVGPDDGPIWFGRGMDAPGALRTTYLPKDDIVGYADHYVMSTERHASEHLASVIADRGWGSMRIGVELDNYYYSPRAHDALVAGLPEATFSDATALVNWQRLVKSPREIEYMRIAGTIVENMHAHVLDRMEAGMRKNDLIAEIYQVAISGTPEHGGGYPAIAPLAPTGVDATAAHLTWDDKPFEKGVGTFFEIAGVHKRYHVPLCRTVFLGTPEQKWFDAEAALISSIDAGLAAAKPGNTCEDMHAAFITELRAHGFDKQSRAGYSIGLSYPPDWGERNISIRPGDTTEFQPGMTFHFMPALWQDDWGMEITESVLITPEGSEPLANVPRMLFVKE